MFSRMHNSVSGIGGSIYNNSGEWGSDGKLTGVLEFLLRDGIASSGLHELAHNWGNTATSSSLPIASDINSGHWGRRNIGGQLGGWRPGSLEDLGGGNYRAKNPRTGEYEEWGGSGNRGVNPYANFELYTMGLIDAASVGHDIKRAEDFEWNDKAAGTFKASKITTMSMDQFIAVEGERIPNYLNSQKSFRGMYVVLSEEPLTLEEWRTADRAVYDMQLTSDNGNTNDNFWEATKGKATISFDQLDSFSKSNLTSYEPTDATVTSSENEKPIVVISGGKRIVITDTDAIAGESVLVTATASDNDGTIASTQWLVEGEVVAGATGLSATLSLLNGATLIMFKATDDKGSVTSSTQIITVLGPSNSKPVVSLSGGNRTIVDTDGISGESVSFTGTATDTAGTIATTQWLVDGSEVATGLTATLSLPNGSTLSLLKRLITMVQASTTTATITIQLPPMNSTDEWPSPYNGVTPDSSFGLAFNNIGVFSASDSIIYTCLRVFTDGLSGSVGGISEFDIGLKVVSLSEATVQITKFREFNAIGALNENAQTS